MSKSMSKIIYYENVLEFKGNNKEDLNFNEVNNWQLCRTCLSDTSEDDVNMEKMNVMDVMLGTFLNVKDMLVETTNIEVSTTENLPLKLCRECISKITVLYYFCIQVRKADNVLRRLACKLKVPQDDFTEVFEMENFIESDRFQIVDNNTAFGLEEDFSADEDKNVEKEFEEAEDKKFHEHANEISENETLMKLKETELLKDQENSYNTVNDSNVKENNTLKYLYEFSNTSNSENEEAETITTTITAEKVQNIVKKSTKRTRNTISIAGYRHKQPRVTTPLLNGFDCGICQCPFNRQQDLVYHVRESHPNSKAYKCRICGNLFSHIQSLSRHMNSHKQAVILNECEICSKSFVRVDDLKRHLRVHTGERPYVCTFCAKAFRHHYDLKCHEEKHLLGNNTLQSRKFECAQCKHIYTSRTGLYLHKKKHHRPESDSNDFQYDCCMCEKSFHLQAELKRHAENHFRAQLIKCNECEENFMSHNALHVHKRKQHKAGVQIEEEWEKENENFKIADEKINIHQVY